jgi:acyl carrier protein
MPADERLIEFIHEELLDGETIDAGTSLFRSQLLDSLALTNLILFIEESFGIRVGAMDISYDNLDSVDQMIAFIDRKRDGGA